MIVMACDVTPEMEAAGAEAVVAYLSADAQMMAKEIAREVFIAMVEAKSGAELNQLAHDCANQRDMLALFDRMAIITIQEEIDRGGEAIDELCRLQKIEREHIKAMSAQAR